LHYPQWGIGNHTHRCRPIPNGDGKPEKVTVTEHFRLRLLTSPVRTVIVLLALSKQVGSCRGLLG